MNNVITVNFGVSRDAETLRVSRPVVTNLAPATEDTHTDLANEHAADPIKDLDTIRQISDYLIKSERYRDNMLFVLGINFGLRVSDLLQLRFSNLINQNMMFKTTFPVLEQKTKSTRKVAKNRYITINDAVMDAVELYLRHTDGCKLSDYLFRGESNRCGSENKPMHRNSVDRILKGIADDLGLDMHMSTHTLRKTFGYHQMMMSGNSQRKLLVLQKMFGHSSPAMTLNYIGITEDEIVEAYQNMNLAGTDYSMVNTDLREEIIA